MTHLNFEFQCIFIVYFRESPYEKSATQSSLRAFGELRSKYLDKETKHKINDFVALNSILNDNRDNEKKHEDFGFARKTFRPLESTSERLKKLYERSHNNFGDLKSHETESQICTVENNDNTSTTIIKIMSDLNNGKAEPKVTSVVINQDGVDDLLKNKKKVEFCKTEVHFTAGEGR
jgi:hypothetical protein